jgi:hypothetical protein
MQEQKIEEKKEEWKELFKDPEIFNIIIKEFDKKVIGEEIPKKTIFLCFCGIYVKNSFKPSYNLIINGKSGIGKDFTTYSILEIFPEEKYKAFTKVTPQALSYYKKNEKDFTWDEKILYLEDITQQTLDSPVLKTLSSNKMNTLSFLRDKTEEINIKGKPIIIMTFANNILGIEYIRRFETCQLDEEIAHSKAIIKKQAERMATGEKPFYNPLITLGLSKLQPIEVIIPFAKKITAKFPCEDLVIRTKFNRFGDYIRASCVLHQLQRKQNEQGQYIAEIRDYEIAREVFNHLNQFKKLIPLTIHQQKIMEYFEKKDINETLSAISIHNDLGQFIALNNLIENLQRLVSYGFLNVTTEIDEKTKREKTKFYHDKDSLKGYKDFLLPKFEKLKTPTTDKT